MDCGDYYGDYSGSKLNICNRCGATYPLNDEECPECDKLSDTEALIRKKYLINARADKNKGIAYKVFALAFLALIITIVSWNYI